MDFRTGRPHSGLRPVHVGKHLHFEAPPGGSLLLQAAARHLTDIARDRDRTKLRPPSFVQLHDARGPDDAKRRSDSVAARATARLTDPDVETSRPSSAAKGVTIAFDYQPADAHAPHQAIEPSSSPPPPPGPTSSLVGATPNSWLMSSTKRTTMRPGSSPTTTAHSRLMAGVAAGQADVGHRAGTRPSSAATVLITRAVESQQDEAGISPAAASRMSSRPASSLTRSSVATLSRPGSSLSAVGCAHQRSPMTRRLTSHRRTVPLRPEDKLTASHRPSSGPSGGVLPGASLGMDPESFALYDDSNEDDSDLPLMRGGDSDAGEGTLFSAESRSRRHETARGKTLAWGKFYGALDELQVLNEQLTSQVDFQHLMAAHHGDLQRWVDGRRAELATLHSFRATVDAERETAAHERTVQQSTVEALRKDNECLRLEGIALRREYDMLERDKRAAEAESAAEIDRLRAALFVAQEEIGTLTKAAEDTLC